MLLKNILFFEAPIDNWVKRYGEKLKHDAEPLINDFQKLSANINNPDATKYDFNQLKLIVDLVNLGKKNGLKSQTIKWLTKQAEDNRNLSVNLSIENYIEDYIPLLKTYEKNKTTLGSIENYESIVELSTKIQNTLENLRQSASEEEKDIFFRYNGWSLAMPHTTEASCELGSETTWCTARTNSQNLFLNYVAREGSDIILFYLIKDNANPRQNPNDKISIGFINGEPDFSQGYGGVTVNADNQEITYKDLIRLFGEKTSDIFLSQMRQKAEKTQGKHPAKSEISSIASNYNLFLKKLDSYKDIIALQDFLESILREDHIDEKILEKITSIEIKKVDNKDILIDLILERKELSEKFLNYFIKTQNIVKYFRFLIHKSQLTKEMFDFLVINFVQNVSNPSKYSTPIFYNKRLSPELISKLYSSGKFLNIFFIDNMNTPSEVLEKIFYEIYEDKESFSVFSLVRHPNFPTNLLLAIAEDERANDHMQLMRMYAFDNPNIPSEILEKYSNDKNFKIRTRIASSPKASENVLAKLSKDEIDIVRRMVAANKNTSLDILKFMAINDKNQDVQTDAAKNYWDKKDKLLESKLYRYLFAN